MAQAKLGRVSGVHFLDCDWKRDVRGGFMPLVNHRMREHIEVVDVNVSLNVQGAMRGLHLNTEAPQAKMVRVLQGRIWDVYLDLRRDSPSFLNWNFEYLGTNTLGLYLPPGIAHGFVAVEPSIVAYITDAAHQSSGDTGVNFEAFIREHTDHLSMLRGAVTSLRDQRLPTLSDFLQAQDYSLKHGPIAAR